MSCEFDVGQTVLYTCSMGYRREMTIWAKSLDQKYLLSLSCFEKPQAMDSWIPASRLAAMPAAKSGPLDDLLTEKEVANPTIVPPSTVASEATSWQTWQPSRKQWQQQHWVERKRHRAEKRDERCRVVVRDCNQDVAELLNRLKYFGEIAHSIQISSDVFIRFGTPGAAASAVKALDMVEFDG